MKVSCIHCGRKCKHAEVANAQTVFNQKTVPFTFNSIDDYVGIEICQVCKKPPTIAKLIAQFSPNESAEVSHVKTHAEIVL